MSRRLLFLLLSGALAACSGGDKGAGDTDGGSTDGGSTDGGSTDGGGTDGGGSTDSGTTGGGPDTDVPISEAEFSDVSATLSEAISAVVTVRWTSTGDGAGGVRFGYGGTDLGLVAAEDLGGGSWEAVLVGLPPETEAWYQLADGDSYDPEIRSVTTGAAPDWFPEVLSLEGRGEGDQGFVSTDFRVSEHAYYAVIVNPEGQPVWWMANQGAEGTSISRVRVTEDRQYVYYNAFQISDQAGGRDGGFFKVRIDGSSSEFISAPDSHHDFWLHEDGTLVYPVHDERMTADGPKTGDRLVSRSPDGVERTIWSSWDRFPYGSVASEEIPSGFYTLANQVHYDSEDDSYWLGLRNLGIILKIDRATDAVLWQLGGADSDFALDSPFSSQHGIDTVDGNLLLHDNSSPETRLSRIVFYELDEEAWTATLEREYLYSEDYYSSIMGQGILLESGNILALWGGASELQELAPDGSIVRRIAWGGETQQGFGNRFERLVR